MVFLLLAFTIERSTELKPILVGSDERERDKAGTDTKRRMRAFTRTCLNP